jgi:lambda repressor-like predicted transcriptional regulator
MNSIVTKHIKIELIKKGLTIKNLSQITGYTREHLSKVINGRANSPKTKKAIALVLLKPPGDLWGGELDESTR